MTSRPLTTEVATTRDGRDITQGWVNRLALRTPQDDVLMGRGRGDLRIYEEVLRDDQVAATFQQRRLAVTSTEYSVTPGAEDRKSKKAAEFIEEQLKHIGFDSVTDKMLYGVFYGYAVSECMWVPRNGLWTLDGIKVRKARRFGFDGDGKLRLLTHAQPQGELMPERKFWHFCTGSDNDDEPYGLGLAHWLYWPVFFKRAGLRWWLKFLDKFGSPTVKGVTPANATDAEKQKLLAALEAVHSDTGVVVPEGMVVELLEATRSGSVDHAGIIDRMNAAIAKVVLSQSMTTDAVGGQYKAEVQKSVRNEVVKADATLICDSFNRGPATWLTEWNFPGATPPVLQFLTDGQEDLKTRAEREKIVFEMGFRPTLEHVEKIYGGDWEERTEAPTPVPSASLAPSEAQPKPPAMEVETFAEGPPMDVPDAIVKRLQHTAGPVIEGMLDQVREALERVDREGGDLIAFREVLDGMVPELLSTQPDEPLVKDVAAAFVLAELAGRYDVKAEVGRGK